MKKNNSLTKVESLLVRACKTKLQLPSKEVSSKERLFHLYRRKYLKDLDTPNVTTCLVSLLLDICLKADILHWVVMVDKLSPGSLYYNMHNLDTSTREGYYDAWLNLLISTIACTDVIKFDGFIIPVRFRLLMERKEL